MTIELKKAAAGLKATFCKAKEGLLNEYTGKYKSRLVCPLPADNGTRLIVEGSRYGKGSWHAYYETPVAGGGIIKRNFSEIFEGVRNDNLMARLEQEIDRHDNYALDVAYTGNIRIPLSQILPAGPKETPQAQPKVPAAG